MAVHEVGLDARFEDIWKFATNILGELAMSPGVTTQVDVKVAYWSASTQILLARKLAVAVEGLTKTVQQAQEMSSKDAAAALDQAQADARAATEHAESAIKEAQAATKQARRMVRATWGLVIVTGLLAIATSGLVFYTSVLAASPPTVITLPAPR